MNLVIDRKRWLRGEGSQNSKLLRPIDGKMCCLGFYGLACGLSAEHLRNVGLPADTASCRLWPPWLRDSDFECDDLTYLNDNDPDEAKIAAIFARHGVTVRFVDEPEGGE